VKVDNSIKSSTATSVSEARGDKARPATGGASGSPAPKPAQDNVSLTSLSSQLQSIERSLADVSIVDTARVDAIKQAISEGRFKINADVVADRLLNTAKELVLNRKD
jgi:negative regulator of flagellin synthesis FlgM